MVFTEHIFESLQNVCVYKPKESILLYSRLSWLSEMRCNKWLTENASTSVIISSLNKNQEKQFKY